MNNIRDQLKKVLRFYKQDDASKESSSSGNDRSRSSKSVRTISSLRLDSTLTLESRIIPQVETKQGDLSNV